MKKLLISIIVAGPLMVGCASTGGSRSGSPDAGKYLGHKAVAAEDASNETCTGLQSELRTKQWKSLVAVANACAKQKNWRSLEVVANQLATSELHSPWGAYYLSLAAEQRGDMPRALWMLELAMKKGGSNVALFQYQKGRLLWTLGELDKGMNEIIAAVKKDGDLTDGHLFLAQVYFRDQEFDKASPHYEHVLRKDSKNAVALTGLSECRLQSGDAKGAVEILNRAISAHPDQPTYRVRLAYVWEEVQQDAEQALLTYMGLRDLAAKGKARNLGFDLNGKIKTLEKTVAQQNARKHASIEAPVPVEGGKK